MLRKFTLDYWIDDGWYVGKIREVPGIFSQGETLKELQDNIKDAFSLMLKENISIPVKNFQSTVTFFTTKQFMMEIHYVNSFSKF